MSLGANTRRLNQTEEMTWCPMMSPGQHPSPHLPVFVQRPVSLGVGFRRVPVVHGHVQSRQGPMADRQTILFSDPSTEPPVPCHPNFYLFSPGQIRGTHPLTCCPTSKMGVSRWLILDWLPNSKESLSPESGEGNQGAGGDGPQHVLRGAGLLHRFLGSLAEGQVALMS